MTIFAIDCSIRIYSMKYIASNFCFAQLIDDNMFSLEVVSKLCSFCPDRLCHKGTFYNNNTITMSRRMQSKRTLDSELPNDQKDIRKKVKGVRLCCCGWGTLCKEIWVAIQCLPNGSQYNFWKKPYTQIWTGSTDKNIKFEEVIRRHLGIIGKSPELFTG